LTGCLSISAEKKIFKDSLKIFYQPDAFPVTQPTVSNVVEFGEAIKNPAYHIPQTEYSGCLDISAHA